MSYESYTKDPAYWKQFEYDRIRGCVCYGGPLAKSNMGWTPPYSWGWVVDDYGNHVQPYAQITGWGLYEGSLE